MEINPQLKELLLKEPVLSVQVNDENDEDSALTAFLVTDEMLNNDLPWHELGNSFGAAREDFLYVMYVFSNLAGIRFEIGPGAEA